MQWLEIRGSECIYKDNGGGDKLQKMRIGYDQLVKLDLGLSEEYVEQTLGAPRITGTIDLRCDTASSKLNYARWSDPDLEVQLLYASSGKVVFLVMRLIRAGGELLFSYNGMPWRLLRSSYKDISEDHMGAFETGNARHPSYTERHYFGRLGNYHWFYFTMNVSEYLAGEISPIELTEKALTSDAGFSEEYVFLRSRAFPNAVGIGDDDLYPGSCFVKLYDEMMSWAELGRHLVGTFAEDFETSLNQ